MEKSKQKHKLGCIDIKLQTDMLTLTRMHVLGYGNKLKNQTKYFITPMYLTENPNIMCLLQLQAFTCLHVSQYTAYLSTGLKA